MSNDLALEEGSHDTAFNGVGIGGSAVTTTASTISFIRVSSLCNLGETEVSTFVAIIVCTSGSRWS